MNVPEAADEAHYTFIHDDSVFSEHPAPIHERYVEAVMGNPAFARRKFYDDCSDIYADAYENATGDMLISALNFACLQKWFWDYLNGLNMVGAHTHAYEANVCSVWIERLHAKIHETKPWRRNGNRIRKPKTTDLDKIERSIFH